MPAAATKTLLILFFPVIAGILVGCSNGKSGNAARESGYTIGGTVIGLEGSGLVIQSDGGSELKITGNGPFTLADAVSSGSVYTLKVTAHPVAPAQSCNVLNGNGVVSDGNVTDITIECDKLYEINVVVSGLQGAGLVLQNNGTDSLPVDVNGGFKFENLLLNGGEYKVSVLSQPEAPTQLCEITGGEGVLVGQNIMPVVNVNCKMSHFLGGSVSGLVASNLVLKNNDGDELVIDSEGAFTFKTSVAQGASYNVSVFKQPSTQNQDPSQTCTPSNASGKILNVDIQDIAVLCVDDVAPAILSSMPAQGSQGAERMEPIVITFDEAILAGSIVTESAAGEPSLVIADEAGVPVTGFLEFDVLHDRLLFVPDTALEILEAYTATVSGVVADLSGNSLQGVATFSFTVRDALWQGAALVESENNGTVWNPDIAMDKHGTAMAVWRQHDGWRYNIWASRFTPKNGWDVPELVEFNDTGTAWNPKVAMDDNGRAIAVWSQLAGVRENIWASHYTVDDGWSEPVVIELDSIGGTASSPEIAVNGEGKAVAVWREYNGDRENIWANTFDPVEGWDSAKMLEMNPGAAGHPHAGIDAAGNAYVVWQQIDNQVPSVWANMFSIATKKWGVAERIESGSGAATDPRIAVNSNGQAFAAWQQSDGAVDSIWVNYHDADGWQGELKIENTVTGNAAHPDVVIDDSGNAMIVWDQYDGENNNIWVNRYIVNSGWQGVELIDSDDTGGAIKPKIALDKEGRALVVWSQSDGDRLNIWANRYLPGSGWAGATLIEPDDRGNAAEPKIVMNPSGTGIAIWRQWDGARDNIMANVFF